MKTLPFNIDGIYPLNCVLELQGMSETDEKPWVFKNKVTIYQHFYILVKS